MTPPWEVWMSIATAFVGSAATLYRFGQRIGKLTFQVDTMWGFLLRRARAELLTMGWAEKKSPITIKVSTLAEFERIVPFLPQVLSTYQQLMARKPPPTEQELFIAFEAKFGDQITDAVCVPFKVSLGACIVALIEACRARGRDT